MTTFGVLTPMIFIKWLTLFKRIGLSVGMKTLHFFFLFMIAVGIPMGYFIGKYESRRTLTNLCDTSDQEIGKQIRNKYVSSFLVDRIVS